MKPQMNHERTSELLPALLRGELDAESQADLETHLAGCADCAAERSSLQALFALTEPEPLSEMERTRLHRAVMAAAASEPEGAPATVPAADAKESRWGPGLYRILGAAALLVIIGVFVFSNRGANDAGLPTSAGDTTNQQDSPTEDNGAAVESLQATDGPQAVWAGNVGQISDGELKKLAEKGFTTPSHATSKAARSSAQIAAPTPANDSSAGGVAEGSAPAGGSTGGGAAGDTTFSGAQQAIFDLESQAPANVGPQIEECINKVIEGMPDQATIPVYAATGSYKGDKVLVLGFLFQAELEIGYDRYMVWAFPKGSCDIPVQYLFGDL
ncbi:MAG: hypothetical protein QOG54_1511 [Actinomycetota bacterium]|jgi:anti-sigma factor RsiW|nr:hypothetical protein [Actinomycetota bacterium]